MNKPASVFLKLRIILFITMIMVLSSASVQAALSELEVSQLYVSIFNRASEGEGNQYWRALKLDMATTADVMLETDAAKQYFGASLNSNQAFIEHIYRNTLNKNPSDDADGIAYWTGLLDGGMSRGQVVSSMVSVINDYAPDGKFYNPDDAVTVAAYNQFLHRVIISSYMAYTVQNTPADWATSTSFSVGLIVTDASETILSAMNRIDAIAAGTEEDTAITIPVSIDLPAGGPIGESSIEVEVFDQAFSGDDLTNLPIKVSRETPTDAYIMLPQRVNDVSPTVYLFSTILPEEDHTSLSAEGTAVSLIMNGMPPSYLTNIAEPDVVKETIRQYSQPFILKFQKMIKADPYVLHLDNLVNVYDAIYLDSVQASTDALKSLLAAKFATAQPASVLSRSATYEVTEDLDLQVTPVPLRYDNFGFYIAPVKEGNYVTGSIAITNDTSAYSLVEITDLVTGNGIIPPSGAPKQTFAELAFSEYLLPPQESFWGGNFSSETIFDINHRDVTVKVITGSNDGLTLDAFKNGPAGALQVRTLFSKVFMPTLAKVLPVSNNAKDIFSIFHNAGVFDVPLVYLHQGNTKAAVESAWEMLSPWPWPNPILNAVIEKVFTGVSTSYLAKLGLKFLAAQATSFIYVYDMTSVFNDLSILPESLIDTVHFPIDLSGMQPTAINRRSGSTIQDEEITLTGYGFKTIAKTSDGYLQHYSPTVNVVAKDKDGEIVGEKLILNAQSSMTMNADGTEIKFKVPGNLLNSDSIATSIEVSIDHKYIVRGGIYDALDQGILHDITLPLESNKSSFIIDIGGLIINSLDKSKVQGNDTLTINTTGLLDDGSYTVFFETRSGYSVPATILDITNNVLSVEVPHYDDMEVGPISVFIKDANMVESNKAALIFSPESVEFLPGSPTSTGEIELGITQPQGLPDILYTLDGGAETAYSAPIMVPDATTVSAWAIKTVDGVSYPSEKEDYVHSLPGNTFSFNGQRKDGIARSGTIIFFNDGTHKYSVQDSDGQVNTGGNGTWSRYGSNMTILFSNVISPWYGEVTEEHPGGFVLANTGHGTYTFTQQQ